MMEDYKNTKAKKIKRNVFAKVNRNRVEDPANLQLAKETLKKFENSPAVARENELRKSKLRVNNFEDVKALYYKELNMMRKTGATFA